ncbi:MAG: flagellar biosynthesis protein FlhB [Burkholderiales bacterium]
MAEDSDLERNEPASPRRLEQAREEGQIPRSPELSAFAVMLAALATLWLMGGPVMTRLGRLAESALAFDTAAARDPAVMLSHLSESSIEAMIIAAPLLAAVVAAALIAPLLIGGWSVAPAALAPDWNRINPLKGFSRLLSLRGAGDLVKAILKALVIGTGAGVVLWQAKDSMLALAAQPLDVALPLLGDLVMSSVLAVAAVMIAIVAVDVPLQLWQYARNLRMSREDLKREAKELEGDPYVKSALRSHQRAAARKRMMAAVPTADVVVTNPTHFAVALRYDESSMRAPTVVAKGADLVAARIRGIAETSHVPILEAPRLARVLFAHAEIGEQIPEKLYTAVAEVLAYVFRLRHRAQFGGPDQAPLGEIEVPAELDPLARPA